MNITSNGMSFITFYLQKFDAKCITNNVNIAAMEYYALYEEGQTSFDERCLYVINIDCNNCKILTNKANFLTRCDADYLVYDNLGPESNALIVPLSLDGVLLCSYLDNFFNNLKKIGDANMNTVLEVLRGSNLSKIMTTASHRFDLSFVLKDSDLTVLEASNTYAYREATQKEYQNLLQNELQDTISNLEYPFFFEMPSFKKRILCPIKPVNAGCYILEAYEKDTPFDNALSPLSVALVATLLSYYISTLPMKRSVLKRDTVLAFCSDVLSGKEQNKDQMLKRAENLHFLQHKENHLLMIFDKNKSASYIQTSQILHNLKNISDCTAILYEFVILIIIDGKDYQKKIDSMLLPYLKSISKDGFRCSLSFNFSSICELANAYEQCCFAAKSGSALAPVEIIYNYKDYFEYNFFQKFVSHFDSSNFCLPIATEILEFDKQNKTQYANTLYYYLKTFKNIEATAKKLHIHRNTITYRINKAVVMFEINLDDWVAMNNLILSFDTLRCDNKYATLFK